MTNTLQLKFPTTGTSKIIVEAGHIYTNEQPTLEHQIGAALGNLLSDWLAIFGAEIEKWLYIDNYNPQYDDKPQDLDETDYISLLTAKGFTPDKVVYETEFIEHAKDVLEYLQKKGYAGLHNNGKTILYKGNILLYDPGSDKYMCALLDACFYSQKLKQADGCITVLDKQYVSQQKGTLTILKKLDVDTTKIFPLFYSASDSHSHSSVDSSNVFVNGKGDISFVQQAIDLLQIVAKLSGSVCPKPSIDIEVGKYGI